MGGGGGGGGGGVGGGGGGRGAELTQINVDLSNFFQTDRRVTKKATGKRRALGKVLSCLHLHYNLVPTGKELKETPEK